MRKPRRLSPEELAPFMWEMPSVRGRSLTAPGPADAPVPVPASPTPISWPDLFGNPNPVEVEVGMGKGLFLLTEAMARPEVNFFGVEIVRKYQLYATTRFAIRRLPNVKTSCADAKLLFRDYVRAGSVAAVHVLFPDPWWKKRHKKRRVFTPEFAADAARAIATGGRLHVASDVEEYYGVMTGIVGAMPAFRLLHDEVNRPAATAAGFRTNFERKAQLNGTPVWRAVYERTGEPITVVADPAEAGERASEP